MRYFAILLIAAASACSQQPRTFRDAEAAVRSVLRDPESARFSDAQQCGKADGVVGQVNAKNGFGGYAGSASYVYFGGQAAVEGSDSDQYVQLMKRCTEAIRQETSAIQARTAKTLSETK